MNYIFRVLNDKDIISFNNKQGIKAKKVVDEDSTLDKALTTVNSHLRFGNNKLSCWVSCSSSFEKVILYYNTARVVFENKRNPIIVIRNDEYNETYKNNVVTKKSEGIAFNLFSYGLNFFESNISEFWKLKVSEINKLQYDFSNRDQAKKMGNIGMILTKEGGLCGSNVLALGYGVKSSEILVLNEIKQNEIEAILSPLLIDLLYSVNNDKFDMYLNIILNKNITIGINKLNRVEQRLFRELYVDNLHLKQIVYSIWQENKNVDLFSLFLKFKEIKRDLLKKYLTFYNINLENIRVVEENLLVVQSTDRKDDYDAEIQYANETIQLPNVPLSNEYFREESIQLVTLAAVDENSSISNENTFWLKGNCIYKNDMTDKVIEKLTDTAVIEPNNVKIKKLLK